MTTPDATTRFTDRTEHYVKHRPTYPPGVLDLLRDEMGLGPGSAVADVGSGTGISTALLLDRGYVAHAVEPNAAMRSAAERLLASRPGFRSVNGTAERTVLPAASVDAVVCMQAFHWFDRGAARAEFARVLRPGGWVMIVWNDRRTDTPFLADYEDLLLRFGTDYAAVRHNNVGDAALRAFYGAGGYQTRTFDNAQHFDFDGLRGRLLSSSYAPAETDPRSTPMLDHLRTVFDRHQAAGRVSFLYRTEVHFGRLS